MQHKHEGTALKSHKTVPIRLVLSSKQSWFMYCFWQISHVRLEALEVPT